MVFLNGNSGKSFISSKRTIGYGKPINEGGGGGKGPEKGYRGLGREFGKFYYDIIKIFRFPPTPLAVKKMTCS